DAGLRHVQAFNRGSQALVHGILALQEPLDALIHPVLRFQHAGQAFHDLFVLAKALFVIIRHHSAPVSRLVPSTIGRARRASFTRWSTHGPGVKTSTMTSPSTVAGSSSRSKSS